MTRRRNEPMGGKLRPSKHRVYGLYETKARPADLPITMLPQACAAQLWARASLRAPQTTY